MENLQLTSKDVNKEKLQISRVAEKIKLQSDLASLHDEILGIDEKKPDGQKLDLSKVKSYLESIKDKERNDIKNEGGAWGFAIQLFLKSQNLYIDKNDKVDGIFGPKTQSAVRAFQENWNIAHPEDKIEKIDGFAGKNTINKMLEVLDQKLVTPENDMGKILENVEIKSAFVALNEIQKMEFKSGRYTIETDKYSYKIEEGKLHKINKPIVGGLLKDEILIVDGKWGKKEEKSTTKENNEKKPSVENIDRSLVEKEKVNIRSLLEEKSKGLDFNGLGFNEGKSRNYFLDKVVSIIEESKLTSSITKENINGLIPYLRKEKVIGSLLQGSAYQNSIDYGYPDSGKKYYTKNNKKAEELIKKYFMDSSTKV